MLMLFVNCCACSLAGNVGVDNDKAERIWAEFVEEWVNLRVGMLAASVRNYRPFCTMRLSS